MVKRITKALISLLTLIFFLVFSRVPVSATTYSATSSISLTVSESTTFVGPGNWTGAGQLPNNTYGPTRSSANMSWLTNAVGGYTLQTNIPAAGLTTGSATWANHAGTIAAPTTMGTGSVAWGFSLSNVAGTSVEAKWNNGANYAAFPSSATTVYSSSAADTTGTSWAVYWKAQSLASTAAGTYTTTVTWTFSTTP